MRTSKQKTFQTLFALCLIVLHCTMSVHAEGMVQPARSVSAVELVQSGESVSTTVYHEHTQADCWERKWIPCGGTWSSNFEYSIGATVYYCSNNKSSSIRNGVRLSSIHREWETSKHTGVHDGEYASSLICDQTVVGTFTVAKVVAETEELKGTTPAKLAASVSCQGTGMSDISISWKCPDQSVIDGAQVTISQNGIYTAMLNWTDSKTGVSHTTTLDYVEISNPIVLIFQSGGKVIDKMEVSYGDSLPEIQIPTRKGYDFKGYYAGGVEEDDNHGNVDAVPWYDEEGNPDQSIAVTGSALKETLTAKWEARSYHIYYGEDRDGDGKGDCELDVTYDEEYGPVMIDVERKDGYIFDGYYLGKERIFDAEGNAVGVWRWDVEGDIILEAVYHKKPASSSGQADPEDREKEEVIVPGLPAYVSGNSASENSISENSISNNMISNNNISGNEISGSGFTGGQSGWGHTGENMTGDSHAGHENGDWDLFHDKISLEHDSGDSGNADESIVTQDRVLHLISENMASGRTAETAILHDSSAVVRAIEVTGITTGILGLTYLMVWMFITKASLAEIYSVRADESRRRLGAALLTHGENAFHIHIRERLLEKGETGRYQIVFRKGFAIKNANRDIIIHCREKTISEVIRPDIVFYIE
ncbi:MAG: hypothetical protein K2K96_12770 [Lachnospiraceae bacterium]|nr:hypothetical protein [Lachnospiraceae bacterium]